MPANIVMANESDATSVPSGKYDVRVSGGELCYFDNSLNKYVLAVAGADGRDDAQVTKIYDSSGNVIAEINGSGGLDVGSPTASSGADGLAVGGDVESDGDMFPVGFGSGIATRTVDLITPTPTSHFRDGGLPTGFSWVTSGTPYGGGSFVDPTSTIATYDLNYLDDYLYLLTANTGNAQHFLAKTDTFDVPYELYARLLCFSPNDVFCGFRFDNGTTDTKFLEYGLYWDSTNLQQKWQVRYDLGAGNLSSTSSSGATFPEFRVISQRLNANNSNGTQQRLFAETGEYFVVTFTGGANTWERSGLIFDHRNNFSNSFFDWIYQTYS
jgi:hypothetical protein